MHVETCFAAHIEKDYWSFQLMGENAVVRGIRRASSAMKTATMVDKSPAWHADERVDRMFRRKMNNFVDHVLYDSPTLAPAATA